MLTERINAHLRKLSDTDKCIWRCIEANRTAGAAPPFTIWRVRVPYRVRPWCALPRSSALTGSAR